MNVCALDVVARTPDFESVASSLELRGWEWDLLHGADGETTLGDIARRMGVDMESAIGFVHEALHRGLLAVGTMSLSSYRARMPMQTALSGTPAPLSLGPATVAAPAPAPAQESPAETHGAISFSSDAFDWNEPEATFDDADADVPVIQTPPATPGKTITAHVGGVHYDERFGVEHPDGPFADVAAPAHDGHDVPEVADAVTHTEDAMHVEDPFAAQAEHEPFAEVALEETAHAEFAPVDDPFAVRHEPEPFVEAAQHDVVAHDEFAHVDDPFAVKHDAEPFAEATHHEEPVFAEAHDTTHESVEHEDVAHAAEPFAATEQHDEHVDDPFAVRAHEPEPEPEQEPVFADVHPPVAATNGHATIAEEPVEESAPGSISFSFSPDDPIDAHEATYEAPVKTYASSSPQAPPPVEKIPAEPAFPSATTIEHHEPVAAAAPAESETQSTYFEREAIDTDASRELEEKSKNWKDSLSWREQQELNAAMETGKEKQGVIGSLLRALGVR